MKKLICVMLTVFLFVTSCTTSLAAGRKYSTLEVTELGFFLAYYSYMYEAGTTPSLEKLTTSTDSVSTYMMSDYASITFQFMGTEISEAMLICSGDGTAASGADIMLNMIISIMIFDPALNDSEIALDALLKMMDTGSYTTEYCQYQYMQSDILGTWLTITP